MTIRNDSSLALVRSASL